MLAEGQHALSPDEAVALIMIEFKNCPIAKKFIEFLKVTPKIRITRDKWAVMLEIFNLYEKGEKYNDALGCILQIT